MPKRNGSLRWTFTIFVVLGFTFTAFAQQPNTGTSTLKYTVTFDPAKMSENITKLTDNVNTISTNQNTLTEEVKTIKGTVIAFDERTIL